MFHDIPQNIVDRMHTLEERDRWDREAGVERMKRLRQIPPETGRFIALMAAAAPPGVWLEIGTSAGYSTLWLALAAREAGARVTTFEVLPEKVALAKETFELAGISDVVTLVEGDAREYLDRFREIAFCFLDADKEVYGDCYEAVIPDMVPGGVLTADNAINHRETLQPMLDRALEDDRVDSLIVPIGKGVLLSRKR